MKRALILAMAMAFATAAEAQLILGRPGAAVRLYDAAVHGWPDELGSHATTWRQLQRLLAHLDVTDEQRAALARLFEPPHG